MRTLAIDFDRCIHPYRNGWRGVVPEDEPPTEGCLEFLKAAKDEGWRNVILSSRATDDGGIEGITGYCDRYGLLDYIDEITDTKVAAVAYIDDRALTFKGDWDAMWEAVKHLHAHGPWHPDDDVIEAQIYPADDEPVWYGTEDRTVHRLSGNVPTGHGNIIGVRMDRYDALNPATTTLCPVCF
jgi:hypothetical protein